MYLETFFVLSNTTACVPIGAPALSRHGELFTDGNLRAYYYPRDTVIPVVRYSGMHDDPQTASFIPAVGGDLELRCALPDCHIEEVDAIPPDPHNYMVGRGLSGLALTDNSKLVMLTTGAQNLCASPAGAWSYARGCASFHGVAVRFPPTPRTIRPWCPMGRPTNSFLFI